MFVTAMRQDTTSALSFARDYRTFAGSPAVNKQSPKLDADRRRHVLTRNSAAGFGVDRIIRCTRPPLLTNAVADRVTV
jgi:hypothetical protein